jgi:hypothetical protein
MKLSLLPFLALSLASVSTACSGTEPPEQACLDTADAVGKAAQRCGLDYQKNYDAFVQTAAGGDCENVVRVRDENALRSTCFTSLQSVSCEDLKAAKLDASCQAQLARE